MAHLLVIGASGGIGLAAVKAGLEAGHRVRGLSRRADAIGIDDPAFEPAPATPPLATRLPPRSTGSTRWSSALGKGSLNLVDDLAGDQGILGLLRFAGDQHRVGPFWGRRPSRDTAHRFP